MRTAILVLCATFVISGKSNADISIYKGDPEIYKTGSHVYKDPVSMPTKPVTCEMLSSQSFHSSLETSPYCTEALRSCIVVKLLEKQLQKPIFRSRDMTTKDFLFAKQVMRQHLIGCQLVIDAQNAGHGNFSRFTGLRK